MIPDELLLTAAWVEGLVLALGWLFLLASGLRSRIRRRRERRLRRVRDLLTRSLLRHEVGGEAREALEGLSRARQREVFLLVAPNLKGREREWLTEMAREIDLVDHGVKLCGSRLWWRRLRGARLLTLVGGGGERVLALARDRHPLVRAQAAEWCGVNGSQAAIVTLVGMLGDSNLGSRFAVQDALVRLGARVVEPLIDELEAVRDPVEAETALRVTRAVGDARFGPAIGGLTDHPDARVRAAASAALGPSGGADAPELLQQALLDEDADVRAAAAWAVGEQGYWQGGRWLVDLLADPSWNVRRAASRALVVLGAPGELLLRRARGSDDAAVADMARHAMDVAAVEQGAR